MKVFVDPACNINYSSFYIIGMRKLFGRKNVRFTSKSFKTLFYTPDTHVLAFVIDKKKYAIDFADDNKIFYENHLEWADVYGKVNYSRQVIPEKFKDKVKRVGPNMGIACYGTNKYMSLLWAIWHYLLCYNRLQYNFKSFLTCYLTVYKRVFPEHKECDYYDEKKELPSVFHVSRYWDGQVEVNSSRIKFIRACIRLDKEGIIRFKGGMVPDTREHTCPKDVLLEKEIPYEEYINLTNKSVLVFNTPAYHRCHGWKLPEYFSQGKVILSTPFVNEMPIPVKHGENIYFVEDEEQSIYEGVNEIVSNIGLRKKLEDGSIRYWNKYINPLDCMKSFLDN